MEGTVGLTYKRRRHNSQSLHKPAALLHQSEDVLHMQRAHKAELTWGDGTFDSLYVQQRQTGSQSPAALSPSSACPLTRAAADSIPQRISPAPLLTL